MPADVRVSRAWPRIGPRRCSSPVRSGRGSAKSNSRRAPAPCSSSCETLTDTMGGHTKKAARHERQLVEYTARVKGPQNSDPFGNRRIEASDLELVDAAIDSLGDLSDLPTQFLQHPVGIGVGLVAD